MKKGLLGKILAYALLGLCAECLFGDVGLLLVMAIAFIIQ